MDPRNYQLQFVAVYLDVGQLKFGRMPHVGLCCEAESCFAASSSSSVCIDQATEDLH
jgi:hypothetical protein